MMTLLITIDSEFVVEILFAPYAGYAALIVGIRHASLIVGTIFGRNSLAVTHYCTLRHQCWRGSRPPKGIEPFDYSESAPGGGKNQKGAPTAPWHVYGLPFAYYHPRGALCYRFVPQQLTEGTPSQRGSRSLPRPQQCRVCGR